MGVIGWVKNKFSGSSAERHLQGARNRGAAGLDLPKSTAIGAGVGAAVGGAIGGYSAYSKIQDVPVESVTLSWDAPVMQTETLGYMPQDDYSRYRWGLHSGPEVVAVRRDNPTGDMQRVTRTFEGHGPPVVEWKTRSINEKTMTGYHSSVREDGHYEYKTEYFPNSRENCVTEYNSDGSTGRDCHTEYFTDSRTVSEWVVDGYELVHNPLIHSTKVGAYEAPSVNFDHGVNVLGHVATGIGLGAVAGVIGGAALWALTNKESGGKEQPPGTKPAPPSNPKRPIDPYYGGVREHAHESRRHIHAGGDRWHSHSCQEERNADINSGVICFKPKDVPRVC